MTGIQGQLHRWSAERLASFCPFSLFSGFCFVYGDWVSCRCREGGVAGGGGGVCGAA